MGNINGKFAEQNDIVTSGQIISANNNQISLNAAIAETNHLRATSAIFQPTGLLATVNNLVPNVTTTLTGTISAALAGQGQQGTASTEPGGGGIPCPEIHDFVLVRSDIDTPIPTQVKYVEVGMYLWNPLSKDFEKLVRADIVEDEDLWGIELYPQLMAVGSKHHPLIRNRQDTTGWGLAKCQTGTSFVMLIDQMLIDVPQGNTYQIRDLDRTGTVRHLETEGPGHIYAAGRTPWQMCLWHNLKPQNEGGGIIES